MSFQLLIKTAQPPGPVTGATAAWTSPNTYVSCSWTATQQYGGMAALTYTVVFYSSPSTNLANGTIFQTFTGISLSTTTAQTTITLTSGLYYFAIIYAVNTARTSVSTTTNIVNPSFASISPPTNVAIAWNQYNAYVSASWTASSGAVGYRVLFYSNPTNSTIGGTSFQTFTTSSVSINTTNTLTLNTYYYVAVQALDSSGKYTAYVISPTTALYYVLPVTNVSISYGAYYTYVTASWTGITNALTVTYTVYFYQNSTSSTSGGSLYQTITGLSVGTTSQITTTTLNYGNYYYAIVTANELGVSSAPTTSSTAVLYYIPYPTNFTMVWNGTSYVYATWTIATYSLPIYYTINFYSTTYGLLQTFTNIGSSSNSQLTTVGLSFNQYIYAQIYTTISGTSSNSITVQTNNYAYYTFTAPNNVALAWNNSYSYLTATWTYATINPGFTTLYNVYYYWSSTNSYSGSLVQTVLGTSNNYQNTTVTLSNGYYYAIVNASNATGTTSTNVYTNIVNYLPTYWLILGSGNNAIAKSQSSSGITFYAQGNTFGSTGYAAAWNGTLWVAVGTATNTISWSYDGVNWNGLGASIFDSQGRGIAWNGSIWVAVGSATNTIAYSSTGTSWNGAGLVFSTVGYGIAWNGSTWVAVGQGAASIYTSTNGSTWTASSNQSTNIFTTSANGGVWSGSLWVVGGSGTNTIATSVDGSIWIPKGLVASSTTVWCVAWSGTYFIAACAGTNPVMTSSDGTTWTGRTATGLTVGYFITVANSGIWVLSGQGTNTIFTATDGLGVTWTARSANTVFTTCFSVCYNATFSYWVGVGTGVNSIAYSSTNGQTWTGASTLNSIIGVGYGVACDGVTWIAVGAYQSQGNFTMATSTNGSSWTGFAAAWNGRSIMQQLRSINYINGKYIVTGQGGAVYYANSLTSNAWVSGAANPLFGPSTTVYNIAWTGSYYLAFSSLSASVTVGLSPDLSSWASVAQIMFTIGWSITWNGSYFLATGQGNNTIARSTDGNGWRGLGLFCFPSIAYSSAWNSQNSVWAVVGQGGIASIWTSTDGYNFYPRTSMIYATTFNSVIYQNTANMFTAVGNGGMIVRAYGTAATWQPTMQTAAWTNYNLTYGNGNWVASGDSGFIVSSNVYETSNDGAPALTDWVPRSIYTIFTTQVNGFAWNSTWNYWLAFGTGTNSIAVSMDGINWTAVLVSTTALTLGGYAGLWHPGLRLWIVGGLGTSPLVTSPNGYTWTVRTPGNLISIYTVVTDGYIILLGGIYSTTTCIASSWDAVTWTNRVASSLTTPYQIIWDQTVLTSGQFIAVGTGTTYPINVSSNGITWTTNTSITTSQINISYGIVWASGFGCFVMVGSPGTTNIAVSTNLSSWSNYTQPYVVNTLFSTAGYGVAWNGSAFVLVGAGINAILYSPDGSNYRIASSITSGTSAPSATLFTTSGNAVSWNPNYGVWIASGYGPYQIAYAFNGLTGWIGVSGSFFSSTGYCLATNGVRTICGGDGSIYYNMAYTDDYVNWYSMGAIISSIVYSASYGNNIWVAGGSGSTYNLVYSYNGTSWVGASNYYGNLVSYVTYCLGWNGSYFLAGGNCVTTFQFATSFNGSNWQMAGTIPFSSAARCLVWSSTLKIWVAGGQGANTLAWSWDGVNWLGLGATIFSTICYGVTWNGSIFVATGSGTNTIATSFDGSNWIPRGGYYQFSTYARSVAYNSGTNTLVVGGTGGSNTLVQTADLVSYKYLGNTVFTTGCYAVAYNGSYWLAGGAGLNTIAYSTDGLNWAGRANTSTSVAMRAAGWNGSYWIGVGAAGSLSPFYRSTDAITWYQTTTYNPGTVYGVQWNGSYWLATSTGTQIYQSSSGVSWIIRNTATTPFSGQVNAVIYANNLWVALGTGTVNTVATSTNGFFWIGHGIYPFSTAGWGAAWNGSIWVAAGAGTNTLAWSSNGSNWIGVGATIITTVAYGVAWSPYLSLWVATGTGTNTIATSATGLSNSWTGRNSYFMQPGYGISWNSNALTPIYPTAVTGLILWLDAADALTLTGSTTISGWKDKSTYNNMMIPPASSNYPTLTANAQNGKSVLTFSGSQYFTGPITLASANVFTHFAVYYSSAILSPGAGYFDSSDGPGGQLAIWSGGGGQYQNVFAYGSAFNTGGSYRIVSTVCASPTTVQVYFNGTNQNIGSTWNYYGTTTSATITSVTVGKAYQIFTGNLAEIVMYSTALSDSDRYKVEGYLAWKWGLQTSLPVGHTYYNAAPSSIPSSVGNLWITVGSGTGVQIGTSPDGLVWTARTSNTVFTTAVYAVGWNGNLYVAVGSQIGTSSDAITWSAQTFTGFTTGWGIVWAYNLSLWVVVGSGTNFQIGTSPDGSNWTGRNPVVFTTAAYNAAWNGSYWVAVGTGTNAIATSTDGIAWIARAGLTLFTTGGSNVVWSGSQWVAVGTGTNAILTSPDGSNWTSRLLVGFFGTGSYGVTYNTGTNTQYVAVGGATAWVQVSPDGFTWTIQNGSNMATTNMFAITNGPTGLMAVGNSASYLSAWSSNGWNWSNTATGLGSAVQTQCATTINNYWVAGTTAGLYYGTQYGSNNTSWTLAVSGNFYAAAASLSISVATATGTYYWSSNGTSWTTLTNLFTYFSYIGYFNGLFIGVGSYTGYSSNGITWYASLGFVGTAASYGASTYVIGGGGSIYTSPTGLLNTWTLQTSQLTSTRFIIWDSYRSMFVAIGSGTSIFQVSGNGVTWTATHASSNFITGTAWFSTYNNNIWTIVGASTVSTTPDGVVFSQGISNINYTLYSVAYSSSLNLYVAVGNYANTNWVVNYATNPTGGWTTATLAVGAYFGYGVAWNGSYFCTVGGSASVNLIFTSTSGTGSWTLTSNTFSTVTYVTWCPAWNLWIGVGTGSNSVAYSYDAVTWVGQGASTWFSTGYGVAYANVYGAIALAVGTGTYQVIYTTNGTSWTGLTSTGFFTTAYAVTGNSSGYFIIVGTGTYPIATVLYNGTIGSLTGVANSGITTVRSIATFSTYTVLCANTNQLWYMNTGTTPYSWTNSGTTFASSAQAVAWNGTYFVAVGLSAIYYSSTGTSWTSTGSSALSYYSIAWNGTYWVAGYQSATSFIAYNSTGTGVFTTGVTLNASMTIPYFLFWASSINGGSGGWVATGSGTVTVATNYSTNGTGTWFSQGAPISTGYCISYNPNNTTYMLVGNGTNAIYTSTNCSNWTGYTGTTLMTTAYTVIYESKSGSNIWCVGGVGNCSFMFTTDQLGQKDWNISYSNFRHSTTFSMVDTTSGPLTAGTGPNIVYGGIYSGSYLAANNLFTTGYAITVYSSTIVAVGTGGSNTILYSTNNGFSWYGAGVISLTTQGRGIAYLSNNSINGIYPLLALGSGTYFSVISLDNGVSWSPPPCTTTLYAVAWSGSYWCLGGSGGNTTIMIGTSGSYPLSYFYGARCWSLFTSVYGVVWNGNNSVFVAVGQGNNTVAISSDNGLTWRGRGQFGSAMYAIAWNGTYYVITGTTATYYSTDAYTWTAATHPFTGTGLAVIWDGNNSRWMLGGNSIGTIIATTTLSPPSSWTAVATSTLMAGVRGLGWNGSYYVAVGSGNNTIAWAPGPGTSWTGLSTTYLTSIGLAIIWYNNTWIAVGQGTYNVAISTNTSSWYNPIFQTNLRGFGWNGSYWIGVGSGASSIAYASTWNNWSNPAISIDGQGYTVVWNGYYWLAAGTGTNAIIYSVNGTSWRVASTTAIFNTGCYGLGWNATGYLWVAVGQGTTYVTATSSDGLSWVGQGIANTVFGGAVYGIAWNGTLWVALGTAGTYSIGYSYNGTSWFGVSGSTNIFSTGYYVVWNGSYFVGVGTGTYCTAYSPDGINWFGKALVSLMSIAYGVAWSGSIWIAVGTAGLSTIAYSYDGNLWQASVNGLTAITTTGYAVQWNGTYSYFMVGGLNGSISQVAYSSDGLNWPVYQSASFSNQSGVIYAISSNSSSLLAVGTPGVSFAARSLDGLTWWNYSNVVTPFTTLGTGAATNGSYILATGTGTTNSIAWSLDGTYWFGKGLLIAPSGSACNVGWNGAYWLIPTIYAQTTLPGFLVKTSDNSNYDYVGVPAWTAGWNITNIGGTFAAVGSNTTLRNPSYSANGIGWTTRYSSQTVFTILGTSVSSNNGIWIMTGTGTNSHAYAYASNGPWLPFPLASFFSTGAYGVAWSGTTWVMVGQGTTNTQITSSNGVIWIARGLSIFATAGYSVKWNGSYFLATGTGTNTTAISTDGLTWDITGKLPFSTGYYIATNSNGLYTATGIGVVASNAFAWSTDGSNWKQRVSSNTIFLTQGYSISYNSNLNYYLAFGAGTNFVAKSLNGYDWFSQPWYGGQPYGVYWNGSYFVGVGSGSNTIAFSSDGSNWYVATNTNIFTTAYCVSFNNSYWLVGGQGNYVSAVSTNTSNFTGWATNLSAAWQIHSPFSAIYGIMWNSGTNNLWVAAGAGTYSLATSTDGSNWIGRVPITTMTTGVTGMFVEFYNWSGIGVPSPYVYNSSTWGTSNSSATVSSISYGSGGVNSFPLSSYLFIYASGYIFSPVSDTLYISVYTSEGVFINVNQNNILNSWSYQTINNYTVSVSINSGYNKVEIFYFNSTQGSPTLRYFWQTGLTSGYSSNLALNTNNSYYVTVPNASIFTTQAYAVGWNGTYWLAGGSGTNSIAMSYDGSNWFVQATSSLFSIACYTILWNGSYWLAGGSGSYPIVYGPNIGSNNSNWYSTDVILPTVNCLAWNGSYWLAGGISAPVVSVSSNGSNWWPPLTTGRGVAYNGFYWIAVGTGNSTIMKSSDNTGQVWFPVSRNTIFSTAYCVAWNGSYWLVGGNGTYPFATSSDGITWTGGSGGPYFTGATVYCLSWSSSAGYWIAGGQQANYSAAYSSDGINWYPSMTNSTPLGIVYGIANNNSNLWVATGTAGITTIAYSYGLTGWTYNLLINYPFSTQGWGIAFSSTLNLWLAVGQGSFTSWTSQDGIWWFARTVSANSTSSNYTGQPILFTTACYGVTWTGSQFVAFGAGSPYTIATSSNGIAWFPNSNITYPTFSTWYAVGYGNGRYIGLGTGASSNIGIAYSTDATSWALKTFNPFTTSCTGIAWSSSLSLWVAVGTGTNTLCTSADGITWTPYGILNQPFSTIGGGAAWSGTYWLAAGQGTNTLASSVDGNWWIGKGTAILSAGSNVLYTNGLFISYGSSTNYQVNTTDLFNYNVVRKPDITTVYTLTYSGSGLSSNFATMGTGGAAQPFYSADGIGWYYRYTTYAITTTNVYNIININGTYYMVGYAGAGLTNPTINYSADGFIWVPGALGGIFGTSIFTYTVNYNNGVYVIGGVAGSHTMAISYDGFTWIPRGTLVFPTQTASLLVSGSYLYAVGTGSGFIAKTLNGVNWDIVGNRVFTNGYSVKWGSNVLVGSNLYVATGTSNFATGQNIAYSYDGVGWATRVNTNSATYSLITSTAYASTFVPSGIYGSYWIAVGAGTNKTIYSYDGLTWWPPAIPGGGQFCYWTGTYIIIGGSGAGTSLIYGTNGSNFQPGGTAATFSKWYGVGWNGTIYVAVGTPAAVSYGNSNSSNTSIAYSSNLQTWIFAPFSSTIFNTGAYGVAWSSSLSLWVAVGQGNTYVTASSSNGSNWIPRATTSLFSTAGYAVLWNSANGVFVASGYGTGTTIAYSSDGSYWFSAATTSVWGTSPSGGYAIAYNSSTGYFVAVGSGTYPIVYGYFYSWNSVSSPLTTCYGIAWNGSMWLAVGSGTSTIAYTTSVYANSGWIAVSNSTSIFSTAGYGVAWNGSLWTITGSGGYMVAYSVNGSNGWIPRTTTPFSTAGYGVGTSGTYVVAVGAGTNTLATSFDGLLWIGFLLAPFPANGYGVAYGNGYWIVSGATNSIAYSSNGYIWDVVSGGQLLTTGQGIAYDGTKLVAVGTGTVFPTIYSYDGIGWRTRTTSNGSTPLMPFSNANYVSAMYAVNSNLAIGYGVCYNSNSNQWVAVGTPSACNAAATIIYSPDGINWNPAYSNNNSYSNIYNTQALLNPGYGVIWSGSRYVAVGTSNVYSGIAYSYNGSNWFGINTPNFATGRAVGWSGSYFIATGILTCNVMFYSTDAVNWEMVGKPLVTTGYAVKWNATNSSFILLGTGSNNFNSILYSYDGIGWRSRIQTSYQFSTGYSVNCNYWASTNTCNWLAVGAGQSYMTSYDGINWYSPFAYGLGVSWNGSYFLAFGGINGINGSTIILSYDGFIWQNGRMGNQFFNRVNACLWNSSFGYWLAAGVGSIVVAYSTNGLDWTARVGANQFFGISGANGIVCKPGTQWIVLGSTNGTPNTTVIIFSSDSLNWYSSLATTANMFTTGAYGGVWNGSLYIVTGVSTLYTVAYSYDGSNWSGIIDYTLWGAAPGGGYAIAWSGAQYVAVGYGSATMTNSIIYSSDGSTWYGAGVGTFSTSGNGVIWVSQCNAFVAVGNGTNSIAYSINNGSNWTVSSALVLFTNGATGIAYDGTKFVATGSNGTSNIATSTDLLNWIGRSYYGGYTAAGTMATQYSVVWNANCNFWFSGGAAAQMLFYSMDGLMWLSNSAYTNYGNIGTAPGYALGCNGSYWIMAGGTAGNFYMSQNGFYWVTVAVSPATNYQVMCNSTTLWGASGTSFSYDGISFCPVFNIQLTTGYGIAYNGNSNRWVAVGGSKTSVSVDGSNYFGAAFTTAGRAIFWDSTNSYFMAVGTGSNTQILYGGAAGNYWYPSQTAYQMIGGAYGVTYANGYYVVVGVGSSTGTGVSMQWSTDRVTWRSCSNSYMVMSNIYGIAYGYAGRWVIAGQGSNTVLAYTTDLVNFFSVARTYFFGVGRGVFWNGSLFVAVGSGSGSYTIASSPDGITWTGRANNTLLYEGWCVTWNPTNNLWVAGGYANGGYCIATSPNGIDWTGRATSSLFNQCCGVVWGIGGSTSGGGGPFGMFVAVGYGAATIATSFDGFTWTIRATSLLSSGYGVAFSGSVWVVVGNGNAVTATIATSSDGDNWTPWMSTPFSSTAYAITYSSNYNIFVAGGTGTNTLLWSYDGFFWQNVYALSGSSNGGSIFASCLSIACSSNVIVASGVGNVFATTAQGQSNWRAYSNALLESTGFGVATNG